MNKQIEEIVEMFNNSNIKELEIEELFNYVYLKKEKVYERRYEEVEK